MSEMQLPRDAKNSGPGKPRNKRRYDGKKSTRQFSVMDRISARRQGHLDEDDFLDDFEGDFEIDDDDLEDFDDEEDWNFEEYEER